MHHIASQGPALTGRCRRIRTLGVLAVPPATLALLRDVMKDHRRRASTD